MKNSIYIGFLGASGSGKTTISRELVENLRKKDYKVLNRDDFSKLEIHLLPVLNLTIKPYLLKFTISWLNKYIKNKNNLTKLEKRAYIDIIKSSLIISLFFRKRKNNFIIADEDPISFLSYLQNKELLDVFLPKLIQLPKKSTKNSLYVFIQTDNSIALERVKERTNNEEEYKGDKNFISKITQEEWERHYNTREENEKRVIDFLKNRGENVIQLDGTDDVSDNVKKIISFINENL